MFVRRLVAVMVTDMVGFTALMEADQDLYVASRTSSFLFDG